MRGLLRVMAVLVLAVAAREGRGQVLLAGRVVDAETGLPLPGATVLVPATGQGAVTDTLGAYRLAFREPGVVVLRFSFVGYAAVVDTLALGGGANRRDVALVPLPAGLGEVVVSAEARREQLRSAQTGAVRLPARVLAALPSIGGERDVLRALAALPGVKQSNELSMGYHVRGGTASENLVLLDDVPVYNPWHFFGFFGAFNPYVLGDVHLMKGAYPAEYGGRLASVLALDVRVPEPGRARGVLNVSALSAQGAVEGSARAGRIRWIAGVRRSYMDPVFWLARLQAARRLDRSHGERFSLGYVLADVNAKVTAFVTPADRLSASVFAGKDRFGFRLRNRQASYPDRFEGSGAGFGWTNVQARVAWRHLFSDGLTSEVSVYGTRHRFGVDAHSESWPAPDVSERFAYDYGVRFDDAGAKAVATWVRGRHAVQAGVEAVHHVFDDDARLAYNYQTDDPELEELEDQLRALVKRRPSLEAAAFVQDDYDVTGRLRLRLGLRASRFAARGEAARRYAALEPRLSARYLVGPRVKLKAGAFATRQYLHQVSDEWAVLASDRWFPADAAHAPGRARQASAGVEADLGRGFYLDVEGYYRRQDGLLHYSPYAERTFLRSVVAGLFGPGTADFVAGEGEAYGAEVFVQKSAGRLTGFLSYTLAWAWNRFDGLNGGRVYPAPHDRRHDLTVTAVYRPGPRVEWAATWTYKTGAPFNVPVAYYTFDHPTSEHVEGVNGGAMPGWLQFTERNRYRMPAYHRLDLAVTWQAKRWFRRIDRDGARFTLSVYNAYNRFNPFMLLVDDGLIEMPGLPESDHPRLLRVGLLPIVPNLSFQLDFK